jgi:NADH:ubiquinone oxidoreductase subunit K
VSAPDPGYRPGVRPVPSSVVPALGITRLVIGAGMIGNPAGLGRALGLDGNAAREAGWLARLAGAREIAIGLGTLVAWRRGAPTAGWVAAQAISDGSDAVAFAVVAAQGKITASRGWAMGLFALSGAVSEALTAIALNRSER